MPDTPDRPSIVLHGFHGGIVNGPDIAVRLARIVLAGPAGPISPVVGSPLQAEEVGDRWSISDASDSIRTERRIEMRKRDAAVLSIAGVRPTDAVPDPTAAEKFATALADNAGSPGESSRQMPFAVIDKGDTWVVRGSYNADRAAEGLGPFCVEIRKQDARVLDMGFEGVIQMPTEVQELLRGRTSKIAS